MVGVEAGLEVVDECVGEAEDDCESADGHVLLLL